MGSRALHDRLEPAEPHLDQFPYTGLSIRPFVDHREPLRLSAAHQMLGRHARPYRDLDPAQHPQGAERQSGGCDGRDAAGAGAGALCLDGQRRRGYVGRRHPAAGCRAASVGSARRRRPAPPKRRRSSSTESRPTNGAFWSGQTPIRSMNWSAGRPSAPMMSISSSSSRARLAGGCRPDIAPTLRFTTGGEVGEGPYLDRPRKA